LKGGEQRHLVVKTFNTLAAIAILASVLAGLIELKD